MSLDTSTIMMHARKLSLQSDEYAFLQEAIELTEDEDRRLALCVSELRVAMMRLSQSLQALALERTREAVKQLALDYPLEHPNHTKTIEQIGMIAKLSRE